jgi:hypothetical protein
MNEPLVLQPKAVRAVLVGGVWHEVIKESFHLTTIEIGDEGGLPWNPAFSFKTDASSEHSYNTVVMTMSGPVSSIQAIRTEL